MQSQPKSGPPKKPLTRRQFIKLLGLTGAASVTAGLGYEYSVLSSRTAPARLPELTPTPVRANAASQPDSAPILLLTSQASENPFGPYLAEILAAEGFTCFKQAFIEDVGPEMLHRFGVILLAEAKLGAAALELLENYVTQGGRLVAMRPDNRLAPLLGVKPSAGSSADHYLQVAAQHPCGRGIATETLQYHGPAGHYALDGAEPVAWLYDSSAVASSYPAVTLNTAGAGMGVLWAFDLARSTAYTRQGNPTWVDQERDGFDTIRTMDPFVDWLDLERIQIPQADELQHLLANLLTYLTQDIYPLPRLWYFPANIGSLLVATADCHTNPAWSIETELERVERYGGHLTVYNIPPRYDLKSKLRQEVRWLAGELKVLGPAYIPSPKQVANWRERGHEFTLHPVVDDGLEKGWQRYWRAFYETGYGPASPTVRTHKIAWQGWVETARLQANHGIRMNLDYYHVGPAFRTAAGEWVFGHFTGSGLPLKFVDESGQVLDIYQQITQLADDHLLTLQWGGHANFPPARAVSIARALFDRSLAGAYAAIGAIFHTDPFAAGEPWASTEGQFLDGTLEYAAEKDIPIWTAQDWLRFWDTRHGARLEAITWQAGARRLSFNLEAEANGVPLIVLLPDDPQGQLAAEVQVDGKAASTGRRTVGGVSYTTVETQAGAHRIDVKYFGSRG